MKVRITTHQGYIADAPVGLIQRLGAKITGRQEHVHFADMTDVQIDQFRRFAAEHRLEVLPDEAETVEAPEVLEPLEPEVDSIDEPAADDPSGEEDLSGEPIEARVYHLVADASVKRLVAVMPDGMLKRIVGPFDAKWWEPTPEWELERSIPKATATEDDYLYLATIQGFIENQ